MSVFNFAQSGQQLILVKAVETRFLTVLYRIFVALFCLSLGGSCALSMFLNAVRQRFADAFYNVATLLTAPLLLIVIFLCWKVGASILKLATGEKWLFDVATNTVAYNGAMVFKISQIKRIEMATDADGAANALNIVIEEAAINGVRWAR